MAFQPAPLPAIGHLLDQTSANASTGYFVLSAPTLDGTSQTRLKVGRKLSADYGAFTLSGQDATLTKASPAYVSPGPLPAIGLLLGADTTTNRVLRPVGGGFSVQGQSVTFRKGRALIAETGYITATGAPAERDIEIDPQRGLFSVEGQAAVLRRGITLVAAGGTFAVSGQQAGMVKEDPTNKVLDALTGYFTLTTHQDNWPGTGMIATRYMAADYGTFALTGYDATFTAPLWHTVVRTDGVWVQVATNPTTWT